MGLTVADWAMLGGAALLIGFAKTGVGGMGGIAVALFAMVLPAKESTAAVLVLLIVGDVLAVALYRKHADWRLLARLLPAVVPGLILGAWFVHVVDQVVMRRSIAVILLAMAAMQLWSSRRPRETVSTPRGAPYLVGAVAGFATMTANAAGPVMTLYLLLSGSTVLRLLGTGAWYFLLVNVAKVPFSAGLGLFHADALLIDLMLVPLLLVGAGVGVLVARRISLRVFSDVTLGLTVVAAILLLL